MASEAVLSVDPSLTTIVEISDMPSMSCGIFVNTSVIVACSLRAGMMMTSFIGVLWHILDYPDN